MQEIDRERPHISSRITSSGSHKAAERYGVCSPLSLRAPAQCWGGLALQRSGAEKFCDNRERDSEAITVFFFSFRFLKGSCTILCQGFFCVCVCVCVCERCRYRGRDYDGVDGRVIWDCLQSGGGGGVASVFPNVIDNGGNVPIGAAPSGRPPPPSVGVHNFFIPSICISVRLVIQAGSSMYLTLLPPTRVESCSPSIDSPSKERWGKIATLRTTTEKK